MTHLTKIRAAVSPNAIDKANRLFNHSIHDILNELLQNARRAGASLVTINLDRTGITPILTISDNGKGIGNPADFVTLGQSNWETTITGEDPAGMGAFALSGTTSIITSRTCDADKGWQAPIDPEAWGGRKDINITAVHAPIGTSIAIQLTSNWLATCNAAIAAATKYYPVPVLYNGKPTAKADWFATAIYRKRMDGYEIGVVEQRYGTDSQINFHGLTIKAALPIINEVSNKRYAVIIDMTSTAGLELVLPARKEVIQNEAFSRLKTEATRAIFEAIAQNESHTLSYHDWVIAQQLGVNLAPAKPFLHSWEPRTADSNAYGLNDYKPVTQDTILVSDFQPAIGQPFDFATTKHPIRQHLAETEPRFEGYAWYDAIPKLTFVAYEISNDNVQHQITAPFNGEPICEITQADKIDLVLEISDQTASKQIRIATPIALLSETWDISCASEITFAWCPDERLTSSALSDLIIKSYFDPSDDPDADSSETQYQQFEHDADALSITILEGEDASLITHLHRTISNALWMIPDGKNFNIAIRGRNVEITKVDET